MMKGLSHLQSAVAAETSSLPPTILVIDDDADMRELVRMHLRDAGYDVVVAEDAVEAGHRLAERLPDLIVADFKMPYMSGVEFVRAVRADETIPDLPVIFITAIENVPEAAGRTFGFPLLAKPFRADELVHAVAASLKRAP